MARGMFHGVVDNGAQMQIVHPFNQRVQSLENPISTFMTDFFHFTQPY
jgi:hypothetical protein